MSVEFGLTTEQAEQSRQRRGDNSLTEYQTEGFWSKFKGNLADPMIKILCVALILNVIFTFLGKTEWYESVGIAVAVLLATLVSTISEYRNENAFQKLQEEASRILCKVYRDGMIRELSINDIVEGDCVYLQPGDLVPADGVLVSGSLSVDQSVLNGESEEAKKTVMPDTYIEADAGISFSNPYKLYRGSIVYSGNAVMSVATVGDSSVYGQIASELQQRTERETPLKVKLSALARGISKFGYIGGTLIAVALLFQRIVIHNGADIARIIAYCSDWVTLLNDVVQALMLAVIIIVMAVPEGLPLMISLVSALNMGKMLRDNVLVRKIAGIETAGSLNIMFSDKTGTITKGQLETIVFINGQGKEYRSVDQVEGGLKSMLALSICRNTSAVVNKGAGNVEVIGGNATERAILGFVAAADESVEAAVVETIPFDSANKFSAAQVEASGGEGRKSITLIKGAPEIIFEKCSYCYDIDGNRVPFDGIKLLNNCVDELAERAIRVLALATSDSEIAEGCLPDDAWTLVGVLGIRDDIREEAVKAIEDVRRAGVQVVMITGDRKETAVAVARDAHLLQDESDLTLLSSELSELSDEQLKTMLPKVRVIARALPSDKSRLVRIAQELGLVVGMTGDGVNDSPALKTADVGFAMGGGTEIAKEASEIIIMDNNFNSIAKAVLYGRTIYNSIRKFIVFQLTINISAVIVSFIAPLLGMENPLTITQILWINLVMDTLAALAFGGEPALARYMAEKPKQRDESIVSPYMWSAIVTGSLLTFGLSLAILLSPLQSLLLESDGGSVTLLTGYFAFFVFTAVFNAFNARTDQLNLFDNISKNRGFIYIILLIVTVQVFLTYFGGPIFNSYGLTITEWCFVLAMALVIVPVDLIRKLILRQVAKS
jgi:calcium-translocating P-type ATPase